ncbi:unnamed protein product [Rhizophagus irregularis]|nr:unnamed protein product [Rhizophagus irregularis]
MQYASGGDLHNWLRKSFKDITWNKQKLAILWQISEGLETIHNSDFIHRDFHSGNILSGILSNGKRHQWQIGDLGLSQPSNNTSSNNEIYGVKFVKPLKLGPEFSEKPHPSAIYTSRSLKSIISKCSSKYSSKDYASIELELDIDIGSRPKVFGTKRNIEEANIISYENNGKHIKISPYSSTSFTEY